MSRRIRLEDRLIALADECLRTCLAEPQARRASPAARLPENALSTTQMQQSARLMRVNRAGEIAAQALYRGQALVAREATTRAHLDQAASEEMDHLGWCTDRLSQLGGRASLLDPLWYLGSVAVGIAAGLSGDSASLGFVAETERQVEAHLENHLERLPKADAKSRAILTHMAAEESHHGTEAELAGGSPVAEPVRRLMGVGGRIFRQIALFV